MSEAPLATSARQTTATNMAAYLRNRGPRTACDATPPAPVPGSSANELIRSHPPEGQAGRFGRIECMTIPCCRAPHRKKFPFWLQAARQSAADALLDGLYYGY